MLIYNILIIVIVAMFFTSNHYKNKRMDLIFSIVLFLLLFLISAFRYYVGTDYKGYLQVFKSVVAGKYINYGFEIGYDWLMYFISFFSDNLQGVFIVTSFIIVGLIIYSINKLSTNFFISSFLFVTMYFYFNSFNLVRQYIAIAFIMFSVKFIKERKPWYFVLCVIVACFFHKTAAITLSLYYLGRIKLEKKYYLIGLGGALLIVPLVPRLMELIAKVMPKYNLYINFQQGSGIGATALIMLGIFIVSYLCKDELLERAPINNLYINSLYIALLTQLLSAANIMFIRISMYFYIFVILLIPEIIEVITHKYTFLSKYRRYILPLFYLFFILWCNYLLISNVGEVVPYSLFI